MSLELWLIRHGQTDWNAEGRIQGQMNSQLSELGIRQAERLGERMKAFEFNFFFSSDSDRAHKTGQIALPEAEFKLDTRLREISFGVLEGKTYDELSDQERDWFGHYRKDPYNRSVPEGESWREHIARVAAWMTDLPDTGRVVAFSHGGSIRAAIFSILGYPKSYEWNLSFGNTGITRLKISEDQKRIVGINDVAHLEGMDV